MTSLALLILSMHLVISSKNNANFKPNVVGSACTPWLLPAIIVCLYFLAFFLNSSFKILRSPRIISADSFIIIDNPVSRTSLEVRPWCTNLEELPIYSAILCRNAITSCRVVFSIFSMRFTLNLALDFIFLSSFLGIFPKFARASQARISTSSIFWNLFSSDHMADILGSEYLDIIRPIIYHI